MRMSILKKTAALAAVLTVSAAVSVFADSAVVLSLQGKVEVNRSDKWIPLTESDTVQQGEVVSTGFKSSAVLRYKGATIQLGPLTRVTLETLAQNEKKDTVSLYLNTGAVKSSVKKTENKRISYTIHNPVAVASVRGTEFVFDSTGDISCSGGAVAAYPADYFTFTTASRGMPADGESGAGTPAESISPGAPAGAVVVLPGQSVSLIHSGFEARPADTAARTAGVVLNTVNTPVNTEGVTTGGTAAGQPSVLDTAGGAGSSTKKGTIKVTVRID